MDTWGACHGEAMSQRRRKRILFCHSCYTCDMSLTRHAFLQCSWSSSFISHGPHYCVSIFWAHHISLLRSDCAHYWPQSSTNFTVWSTVIASLNIKTTDTGLTHIFNVGFQLKKKGTASLFLFTSWNITLLMREDTWHAKLRPLVRGRSYFTNEIFKATKSYKKTATVSPYCWVSSVRLKPVSLLYMLH